MIRPENRRKSWDMSMYGTFHKRRRNEIESDPRDPRDPSNLDGRNRRGSKRWDLISFGIERNVGQLFLMAFLYGRYCIFHLQVIRPAMETFWIGFWLSKVSWFVHSVAKLFYFVPCWIWRLPAAHCVIYRAAVAVVLFSLLFATFFFDLIAKNCCRFSDERRATAICRLN